MNTARNMAARIGMLFGIGRVGATRTDLASGRATLTAQVRFPETGEVRDGVPVVTLYGVASRPRPGADAAVLFVGGNRSSGVVIATGDGRFMIELREGEVALHTHDGSHVHVKLGGEIAIRAATKIRIDTPLLEVTGDVVAGAGGAGAITLLHHRHNETGARTQEPSP